MAPGALGNIIQLNQEDVYKAILYLPMTGLMILCGIIIVYLMRYIFKTTVIEDTSNYLMKKRKRIGPNEYADLAEHEFYKLQGLSMNDVIRTRITDINLNNKILLDPSGTHVRKTYIDANPSAISVDANSTIYINNNDANNIYNTVEKQLIGTNKTY